MLHCYRTVQVQYGRYLTIQYPRIRTYQDLSFSLSSFSFLILRSSCLLPEPGNSNRIKQATAFLDTINPSASQSPWNVAHLVSGPKVSQSLAWISHLPRRPPTPAPAPAPVRRPPFGTHGRFPDWIGLACRHSSAPEGPPISLHSLSKLSEGLTFPRLVGLATDLSSHLDLSRQVRSRLSLPGPRAQDVFN